MKSLHVPYLQSRFEARQAAQVRDHHRLPSPDLRPGRSATDVPDHEPRVDDRHL